MPLYRIIKGKCRTNNHRYVAGEAGNDIIESDRDLNAAFAGGRFLELNKVQEELRDPHAPEKVTEKEAETKEAEPETPPEPVSQERTNITDQFPVAAENELCVFTEDGAYWVTEADTPDENVNDTGMNEDQVSDFIHKYVEG